jgi:hypothetical protein
MQWEWVSKKNTIVTRFKIGKYNDVELQKLDKKYIVQFKFSDI